MKIKNLNIILLTIVILLVIVPSFIKVKQEHNKKLWDVTNKEVIEAAQKCRNESGCLENKVTIDYLINKGYLNNVVNPLTKEIINKNSYYDYETKEFIIIP